MPDIFDNEAFCPLAWNGIYVNPQGKVDTCCISDNNLGNINEQSVDEIVNGPKARAIRESMLRGEIVPGCRACYPARKDARTLRKNFVEYFGQRDRSLYQSTDAYQLKYADFRLRNTCNYGCMYCSPELSSIIAAERKIFPVLKEDSFKDAADYFLKNAETLDRIYLAGGEPLLVKENELLIGEIVRVNPKCHILVNTNLSQASNSRIFDLLISLPNVHWLISAEDMGSRYEYIRYLGKWDNFCENLRYLRSKTHPDHINFNMVYLALNSRSIMDFVRWLQAEGFDSETMGMTWVDHELWDPSYLPQSLREQIFQDMDDLYPNIGEGLQEAMTKIRNRLEDAPFLNPKILLDNLRALDQSRGLDFTKIFPEIYQELAKSV